MAAAISLRADFDAKGFDVWPIRARLRLRRVFFWLSPWSKTEARVRAQQGRGSEAPRLSATRLMTSRI